MTFAINDHKAIAKLARLKESEGRPQSVVAVTTNSAEQPKVSWVSMLDTALVELEPVARYNALRSRTYAAPDRDGA
jgi:hypothetical protein